MNTIIAIDWARNLAVVSRMRFEWSTNDIDCYRANRVEDRLEVNK